MQQKVLFNFIYFIKCLKGDVKLQTKKYAFTNKKINIRALIVQKHLSSGTQIFRHLSTLMVDFLKTVEDQADHFEHVVLVAHVLLNKTA
ncbi:hypothetical protein BpHYR1_023889 [Brachionus plicatilis]|uniref:Uncharacterized protein n=1 Tax=Brachionus plicatilis TaxID=10195 RepID=A0A3M7PDJ9_BRAPC|nr:hypothetical protein BpHYR1_023889 [Brachionus plicatilis]